MKYKTIDFSKYSSFKIGQKVDVAIIEDCNFNFKDYYIIGSCNNTLIGTNPPPLAMLSKKFDYIKIVDNTLSIGGATPVYMNAGLKEDEIFNNLLSIRTCSGEKNKKDIKYGYRFTNINEVILEANFSLKYGFDNKKIVTYKSMRSNQPSTPSAGSCFKNPVGDYAGRLIEEVGLKGKKVGAMEFSNIHANFLVNNGGGTFKDAMYLITEAKNRIYNKFNIWLECEIVILEA